MEKIAVMMSIVSNTRVDIVARGVIKACLELGKDPAETIAIFRIPGAWEEEGFKILDKYGIEYCDRSVSMHEAARRAVEKIQGEAGACMASSSRGHHLHRPGHHRARGREPDPRVPGLRLEDRRRRDARAARAATSTACRCSTPSQQVIEHNGGEVPDGSVVTVPPAFTKDAVFEALENGIKLVVIVTERIPRRDVAQMVELADEHGARIIGPNCLGLIVPGVAKMGGIGGPAKNAEQAYQPGQVGVMSRSGGMTTEISSTLTAAGLGVSTAISIGGDAIIGSTYAELMPHFEADEQTEAIVIYTEPGGRMEAQLAEWVAENDSRLPIVAFMAGPLHGRRGDEGHELRPRRHDRRGQGGHGHREDRPAGGGRHPGGGADRRDPRCRQGEARGPA